MPMSDPVYVRCQLSRGGFSSERVFRLTAAGGEEFVGSAPLPYCQTAGGKPLTPEQPPEGVRMHGRVAARVIRRDSDGSAWLSFPDGSVAQVWEELVIERKPEGAPHVPLQS
jgi:hypothetical protein